MTNQSSKRPTAQSEGRIVKASDTLISDNHVRREGYNELSGRLAPILSTVLSCS